MMIKNKIRMGDIISESYYKKDNNSTSYNFLYGDPKQVKFRRISKEIC